MKKIASLLILILFIFSISYGAETFSDFEVNYPAVISNPEGANYVITVNGKDVIGGVLKTGDSIKVYYETEREDDLAEFYFINSNETEESQWQAIKKIYKADITPDKGTLKNIKYTLAKEEETLVVVSPIGLKTYEYPTLIADEKAKIAPNTRIKVKHLEDYKDGNWYYVTSNKTFVYAIKGRAGFVANRDIITPNPTKMYESFSLENGPVVMTVEPNMVFGDYVRIGKDCFYVSLYGKDGYLKYDSVAFRSNGEKSVVWFENTNLYREASFSSERLYDFLPINTEIEWEYNTDINKYGWVRTTYKNLTGWVFALNPKYINDESEEAYKIREEYFNILKYGEVKPTTPTPTSTVTPVLTTTPENAEPTKYRPYEDPDDEETDNSSIILIVCGLVVILLLLIIIMIVMGKRSRKPKMPKPPKPPKAPKPPKQPKKNKNKGANHYNAFDNYEAYQKYNNQNNNNKKW